VPVDRTLAEDLAGTLVALYDDAAVRIAQEVARQLRRNAGDVSAPAKLGAINDLRNATRRIVARLDADTTGTAHQAIVLAWQRGGNAALDELKRYLDPTEMAALRQALPGAEAINVLVKALVTTLRGTHLQVLRWPLDAYREVIARTALTPVLMGTKSRLAAAQTAWDQFLSRGITGFVDKSGRRWQLASYVEMATRTGVAQAAIEAHNDRLNAAGVDLRLISDSPQECIRCRPWEGKVLATSGPPGARTIERQSMVSDKMLTIEIAGTLDEAIDAGLFHPNCRHNSNGFLPGATKPITNTEDPEGDAARQKLRQLERNVRIAKTQAQAAITGEGRKQAEAKVRAIQQQIRDHVADTSVTTLFRQRHREQIGTAR
jgi:anti-sigma28 factor (negative regulator of flagellin synthesis)